jgi:hypothetical protein
MNPANVKSLKVNRLSGARGLVVFFAAIGLLLQSYLTQTHIHFGSHETGGVFRTASHKPAPLQGPLDKASACPLCQAIVHAGVFTAPSAPVISLSFRWVKAARLAFAGLPAPGDIAHDWRSRAPPRA